MVRLFFPHMSEEDPLKRWGLFLFVFFKEFFSVLFLFFFYPKFFFFSLEAWVRKSPLRGGDFQWLFAVNMFCWNKSHRSEYEIYCSILKWWRLKTHISIMDTSTLCFLIFAEQMAEKWIWNILFHFKVMIFKNSYRVGKL